MNTLLRSTRSRILAVGAAAALAAPLMFAGAASAGTTNPLTGTVSCNATTGLHEIDFTLTNITDEVLTIESAQLSGADNSAIDFEPNPVDPDGEATSSGTLPGNISGALVLTVELSWVDGEFPMTSQSIFTLTLDECDPPASTTTTSTSTSTTSTTAPTTTTTTPPAVTPVVVTPVFTG